MGSETEGFYVSPPARNAKQNIVLVSILDDAGAASKRKLPGNKQKDIMLQIYRPNTGLQVRHESLAEIQKKYKKVTSDDAMSHWIDQYDASASTCSHAYWRGSCRNLTTGNECEVNIDSFPPPPPLMSLRFAKLCLFFNKTKFAQIGLRRRSYTILSGSILGVWQRIEHQLSARSISNSNKMQVIRLKLSDGSKVVGILVPKSCVDDLIGNLSSDAEKVEEKRFTDN